MCGRFTLQETLAEIAAALRAKEATQEGHARPLWDWTPSYNIAPAAIIPVIAFNGQKERKLVPMRWGLHPHWKKQAPEGRPLFNARVESAAEKPSFRTPFRRRRALIPATGWYEWEGVERPKTPNFIHEAAHDVFAFAGLWDQWRVDEGITLLSCTILTTPATGSIKHLHHRMPVRLPRSQWDAWLDWDHRAETVLTHILGGDDLISYPVNKTVNSGRADGVDLIKRAS